jgi:hypothetical protein
MRKGGERSPTIRRTGRIALPDPRTRPCLREEIRVAQTGVPWAAVRIEDPQLGSTLGRSEPAPIDDDLRPLSDDVATEADPAAAPKHEAEAGPGRGHAPTATRLQHEEQRARPTSEGDEPVEPLPGARPSIGRIDQVDDEDIDGPRLEQRPGERETLVRGLGREHEQPLEVDAPGHGLDRVEAAPEIQPGDDRAGCLGLGDESQREGRPAARWLASERKTGRPGDAPRTQQRIQLREPGRDDRDGRRWGRRPEGPRRGIGRRGIGRHDAAVVRQGDGGERPHRRPERLLAAPRRGLTPALSKGRHGGRDRGGTGAHGTIKIEQMFYRIKARPGRSDRGGAASQSRSPAPPVLHSRTGRHAMASPRPGGDVAQLGEHRVRIAGVRGSSPLISTIVLERPGRVIARWRRPPRSGSHRPGAPGRSSCC